MTGGEVAGLFLEFLAAAAAETGPAGALVADVIRVVGAKFMAAPDGAAVEVADVVAGLAAALLKAHGGDVGAVNAAVEAAAQKAAEAIAAGP